MTENTPERLRDATLRTLTAQMENGSAVSVGKGEDREVMTVDPTPSLITAAVAFLKAFPPAEPDVKSKTTSDRLKAAAGSFTPRIVDPT